MAYSATLAHVRGILSADDHMRLLRLFSRAGLSMDHAQFDAPLLQRATAAILKTRDGMLRAAVPVSPMGECVFLNDVTHDDMCAALEVHKNVMRQFPRNGEGLDAFVDASDTGYTVHGKPVEDDVVDISRQNGAKPAVNGHANGHTNGHIHDHASNGVADGLKDKSGRVAPQVATAVVEGN